MKLYLASASPRRFELMKTMPFAFEVYVPKFDERAYETALKQGSGQGSNQGSEQESKQESKRALTPAKHEGAEFDIDKCTSAVPRGSQLTPAELTRKLALGKALCAYRELKEKFPDDPILVLSADTIVTMHGEVFGKGETRERSLEMLHKLNGQAHEVISSVWLVGDAPDGKSLESESISDAANQTSTSTLTPGISESIVESSTVYFGDSDDALIEWYVDTYKPYDKAGAYGIQDGGALLVDRIEGSYHNIVGIPLRSVYLLLRRYLDGADDSRV